MAGVKGQKNPSKHRRKNRYSAGTVAAIRDPETIAFRPLKGVGERIKADMEARGLTKQQWCDEAVACLLGLGDDGDDEGEEENDEPLVGVDHPLIQDAITTSIGLKLAALKTEQKKGKRQDRALIEKWQSEIETLKAILDVED